MPARSIAALLPGWFDEVRRIAPGFVRRMAVIEKPDEWLVLCELDPERVDPFTEALDEAWSAWSTPSP